MRRRLSLLLICLCWVTAVLFSLETGIASYYAGKFQGRLTANGEIFDTNRLTAAHKSLPFNTIVNVINAENGKSVVVRINDRGPFVTGRIIDLSRAAAEVIDMVGSGLAEVSVEVLTRGDGKTYHKTGPPSSTVDIQVGAFGNGENAERTGAHLEKHGFTMELETLQSGITRVVVVGVSVANVVPVTLRLDKLGYPDILIRSSFR